MKTKIIATVGKKTDNEEMMKAMVENGMDIARITFSHCTYDEYKTRVNFLRSLEKKVEIMQDLQGPKIRFGNLENSMEVKKDEVYNIKLSGLEKLVKTGDSVLVHDGKVRLEVVKVTGEEIEVKALNDGL